MSASLDLQSRLQSHPLQKVENTFGTTQYRHAGASTAQATHVLLHGIGSGSGSWLMQLDAAIDNSQHVSVLAWEAPGYGDSTRVSPKQPLAIDYGQRVWAWLDSLEITHPITLVGHSLGALMAASAASTQPERVSSLVLLAPAQGYGLADATLRQQKLNDRLHAIQTLGPKGMAKKRGAAMLSSQCSAEQLTYVQSIMAQVDPSGYTQAAHLLSQGDIATDLRRSKAPLIIASGRADGITPMTGCQHLAGRFNVPWQDLGEVGHACALEGAATVNTLLGLCKKTSQ
jgi:pimeloyl-ACP methyl ester carboxylesterase